MKKTRVFAVLGQLLACTIWLVALGTSQTALADARILLTLEWPPYSSLTEPGGGTMAIVVNQAFHAIGEETRIGYFSWHRVLQLPRTDRRFAATFPMYYSSARTKTCYFSNPIGESPLNLVEPRSVPLHWKKVEDLIGHHIGVVQGYVNSVRFDELAQRGRIHTLAGETDTANLQNLLAGKVEAAVIDPNVFRYIDAHQIGLKGMSSALEINPQPLTVHALYVCFPRDHAGLVLRDRFDQGLRQTLGNAPALIDERPGDHP